MTTTFDPDSNDDPEVTDDELAEEATTTSDWERADDALVALQNRLQRFVEVFGIVEVLRRVRAGDSRA